MMTVGAQADGSVVAWRLCKTKYAAQWDNGLGAANAPGRWNEKDAPIVYACLDAATPVLELAVHVQPMPFRYIDTTPHTLVSFRVEAAASIQYTKSEHFPNPNWLVNGPPTPGQRAFLRDRFQQKTQPFVAVPSVVAKQSWVLLFDPRVAQGQYSVVHSGPYSLDTRLAV